MNRSNIHLLDLPDEILFMILKKLNNVDVLYSLLDVNNGRLNILAQENTFTNILKFVSIDDNSIINRFCSDILPRIHHNVKCFILYPAFMERILLAVDYPNLTELKIVHFQREIASNYFTNESSLRSIFQEQITNLSLVNIDRDRMIRFWENYTTNVYNHILTFFKNLKILSVIQPFALSSYPALSLCYLPSTTFSSSILTHLHITVKNFDDCLCLLDGRLRKLTTLFVVVEYMDKSSGIIHNMDQSFNLKYFSLKSCFPFKQYDKIISLLRHMSYLEKLSLYLPITGRNRVIDGTDVQHDILDYMLQLHSFTFCICTQVDTVGSSYKLSSEDIQQTLTNIGQQYVSSMFNQIQRNLAACSIFSLPFEFDYLRDVGNTFPDVVFRYVTYLYVKDTLQFKHEFFIRIARSFPLLKYLVIFNIKPSVLLNVLPFPSDNGQLYSTIEYPYLIRLDVRLAHWTYLEQFLNETKTKMPCLTELGVMAHHLKVVTNNFKREETRRNCVKVKELVTTGLVGNLSDFRFYFPSLSK